MRAGRAAADRLYIKTLRLARLTLGDHPGAREVLSLGGKRKQSLAGFIERALTFYDNIIERENYPNALADFNHDRARLKADRETVARVRALNAEQELLKGDARTATRRLHDALKKLKAYMRDYRVVVKLALADKPEWRVKLGMR